MDSQLQFTYPGDASKRKSFRASFTGLRVIILGESFDVHDLSTSGLSFTKTEDIQIFQGRRYSAHVTIASRVYIADIPLQIVRIAQNLRVACRFIELTPRQEIRLDKLILEMQKRSIMHIR